MTKLNDNTLTSENLKNFGARVKREAVLKSLLIGLLVGMTVAAYTELLSWIFGFKEGIYLAIALLVAVTSAVSLTLYFKKYRPSVKAVAARIDEFGLNERVLTMLELRGDDSYIAKAQRDDTQRALKSVNHSLIKFAVASSVIAIAIALGVVTAGMTAVSGLAYAEVIPSGIELLQSQRHVTYYAQYAVKGDDVGNIYFVAAKWDEPQLVTDKITVDEGDDAPAVIAVANPGYIFTGWSDGVAQPLRQDASLHGNVDVYALFEKVDDVLQDDEAIIDDLVYPPTTTAPPSEKNDKDNPNSGDAAGASSSRNQIIDGDTYYGHGYQGAVDEALDSMNGDNTPDMYKDAASGYLDALNPGDDDSGN